MSSLSLKSMKQVANIDYWIILALCIFNIFWFFPLYTKGIIMGDDIGFVEYFMNSSNNPLELIFGYAGGNKYRPVLTLVEYLQVQFFKNEYSLYFIFNLLFNCCIIVTLYWLLKKITSKNIISFVFSLFYIISKFSFYNITQLFGIMEALCLFFLLLVIKFGIKFYETQEYTAGICSVLFVTLLIFTHERYIVLVLVYVVGIQICDFLNLKKKIICTVICLTPFILNFSIKTLMFKASFLEGTGGQGITFSFTNILSFFLRGLLSILGINIGPSYLNGYTFTQYTRIDKILILFFFLASVISFLIYLFQTFSHEKMKGYRIESLKLVLMTAISIGALIISGCVTIRLEMRWLYAPFLIYLLYFSYIISQIKWKLKYKYIFLMLLSVIGFMEHYKYRENFDQIYFARAMKIANYTYDVTIRKYGEQLANYDLYFIGNNELKWAVGSGNYSIFSVYLNKNPPIIYIDDLAEIESTSELIKVFEMQPDLSVHEIEFDPQLQFSSNILESTSMHIASPDTYADTPSGTGVCFLDNESFTVLSGYSDTVCDLSFPKNSELVLQLEMPYLSSDGAHLRILLQTENENIELLSSDVYPTDESKRTVIPIGNNTLVNGNLIFEVTSPSGNAQSDWVTIRDANIMVRDV